MDAYYRNDLARIHDEGFAGYAEAMAPGLLAILGEPTEVLEIGCGSGALTRQLVDAGHAVTATDSSKAMIALSARRVPEATIRLLTLGEDPIPRSGSIVSVGHVVNYLASKDDIFEAATELARAKSESGVLVFDVCDLSFGHTRSGVRHSSADGAGWSLDMSTIFEPPDRFIRGMTTRVDQGDGTVREDHETHINVLVEADDLVEHLESEGFPARSLAALGGYELPEGMLVIVVDGQLNS